ncbi:MAG TPA: T9SS type A sorting domain-containing protein, partial [Mucilaginibacter sp.]|nr:T9SS type A sorting domain-containing protein [Mucilaginibacter sp.]
STWNNLLSNITVYPNPTASVINLTMNQGHDIVFGKIDSYKIRIVNSFGTVVKEDVSRQPNWRANIGDLRPGTYLVQVTNGRNNSLVGTASFVKD